MFATVVLLGCGYAESVELSPLFQDSMVLQHGMPVPVWGKASPREAVEVRFRGHTRTGVADAQGKWMVSLPPLPASSDGSVLYVQGLPAIKDVLVGEVWLAAGQSNMEWPLRQSEYGEDEIRNADRPKLRLLNRTFAGQFVYAKPFDVSMLSRSTPTKFFSGTWSRSSPQSAAPFSAIAYTFGRILMDKLDVPVGIVSFGVGGSPAEAWLPRSAGPKSPILAELFRPDWLNNPALDPWPRQRARENLGDALAQNIPLHGDDLGPNHAFKPGFLFDSGVATLAPMAFRGALWYQGESNALSIERVVQHETIFPAMVQSWRDLWGRPFPFLYCQLSSIGTEGGYKSQFWPEFRDQQRRMLGKVPNSGMAVTSDVGHPTDVHPRNKRVVGERLAAWALSRTYGHRIVPSGPTPRRARGSRHVVVEFDHCGDGLVAQNGPIRGFELAGADGRFFPAEAEIVGNSVRLSSEPVMNPKTVRYGWRPYTDANLANREGLPASTFQINVGR